MASLSGFCSPTDMFLQTTQYVLEHKRVYGLEMRWPHGPASRAS